MEITWKNVLPIPTDWNSHATVQSRITFVGTQLAKIHAAERALVYIDEPDFICNKKSRREEQFQANQHV